MAFQTDIRTTEAFRNEVLSTTGALNVAELYADWAEPCKAICSTLKGVYFSHSDRPLKFFTVNVDKVAGLEQYRGKSQPVFLLYKDGAVQHTVTGPRGPQLTQLIVSAMSAPQDGGKRAAA